MKEIAGSFIVSYSFSNKDTGVLIVGKQTKGKVDIVNAFQNEEAKNILDMLVTKKKSE